MTSQESNFVKIFFFFGIHVIRAFINKQEVKKLELFRFRIT